MDRKLVEAAQHGDRDAFAAIADELARPFLAAARRILHDLDLAEDATQEALVGIWRGIPKLREPDRFDAWAYRLLVRACQAEAAKTRRSTPMLRSIPVDPGYQGDDIAGVVRRDELDRAFRRVSIEHRTVIVLRYFLDLPLERVAEVLGIPEGTAGSRLHYAIRALRTAVDADARPATREASR